MLTQMFICSNIIIMFCLFFLLDITGSWGCITFLCQWVRSYESMNSKKIRQLHSGLLEIVIFFLLSKMAVHNVGLI